LKRGDIKDPHKYIRRVSDGKGGWRYIYFESDKEYRTEHQRAMDLRKEPFTIELNEKTKYIIDKLNDNGHEAYIVGGAVRDSLMGKKPKDFDIVSSAKPEQIQSLFGIKGSVGAKFAVNIIEGHEVASYRIDDEEATSAKETEVSLASSADEDVRRRDFTVNALLYDPVSKQIFDFVGGLDDVKNSVLRFVGDPDKRIRQDPMRMLRAIRFANNKALNMDLETFKAIQRNADLIKKEAPERIMAEFMKMLEAKSVMTGLYLMLVSGLLERIFPELHEGFGIEQNRHHAESILYHNFMAADAIKKDDPLLRLAALLHDVGKVKSMRYDEEKQDFTFLGHEVVGAEMAGKIMKRLRFSVEDVERVTNIINKHMYFFTDESKDKVIKKFMSDKDFRSILRLRLADRRANLAKVGKSPVPYSFKKLLRRIRVIETTKQPISLKELAINGIDLINIGLKPGPLFGKFLNNALELILEQPEKNQKEILLEFAKKEFDIK
jgi:poly(A) polymerase/tRNA nucleotidyltransferase (CCA-adding enzyme)